MFNLSWSEVAIILVLAILIINPKDLPEIMRGAGKLFGKVKRMGRDFMSAIEDAAGKDSIKEFRDQIDREQEIIGKAIDLEGNEQELYDVSKLEDTSRAPKPEESKGE